MALGGGPMADPTVTRTVEALGPDATVDAALEVVRDFEDAGFRLDEYTWAARSVRHASSIQLRFVAEGAIAAAPPERPRSVATRDNPTHEPKRLAVAVILIVVIVSGFGIYWAATEESRQWEQLCSIPELALDYPDKCR